MRARTASVAVWALAVMWPGPAAAQSDLERARAHYNAGQFTESIAAAAEAAKRRPEAADSATLIASRARLERFRAANDRKDLAAARAGLVSLSPRYLAPQEAIEWQIGVGTALFLDDQPGPAAEMFAAVLPEARGRLPGAEVDKLVEWWATTLSRVAEGLSGAARKDVYARLEASMREELDRNPLSRPASYWLAVASRGLGDLDTAWNAAVAAWIRAGSMPESRQLRADLERFVIQTLIPERAQARTGQRLDSKAAAADTATMTEEWRSVIGQWK